MTAHIERANLGVAHKIANLADSQCSMALLTCLLLWLS